MNSTEPIDFFRHARHAVHRSSSCQLRYIGDPSLVLLTVHSSSVKSYARLSHDPTRIRMRSPLTRRGTCSFIDPPVSSGFPFRLLMRRTLLQFAIRITLGRPSQPSALSSMAF